MSEILLAYEDVAWFRDDLTAAHGVASRLARRVGLSEHRSGEVRVALAEATSNLKKHAVDGAVLLRVVRTAEHAGVEFLAVDRGPGITDTAASLRDGRSTAGTLGIGLGMTARLADTFDLHSLPGQGTVLPARFWPRTVPGRPTPPDGTATQTAGGMTRPISGEHECGDGWAARWDDIAPRTQPTGLPASGDRALLVMLCDGLGHGALARTAAQAAVHAFHTGTGRTPEDIVQEIHREMGSRRGAAVAVARIEPAVGEVSFCGVGNNSAAIITGTSKTGLVSMPGTTGGEMYLLRTFTHPLPPGSALVLHSDGLSPPRTLPGVLDHSPTVIAAHLLRSVGKHHDDAIVTVIKGLW